MGRYYEVPQMDVKTSIDTSQFAEVELAGSLLQYKHTGADYLESIGVGGSMITSCVAWGDRFFFGACDKNFYCLDRQGNELWRFPTNGIIVGNASFHDDLVLFESGDRNIYALDALTGRLAWRFQTNAPALGYILVRNGIAFANSFDKHIYALDAATGRELWRIPTVGAQTGALEKDGVLYFGYVGGVFYAYDLARRTVRWTFKTKRDAAGWEPGFWGDYVILGSFEGNVYALHRKNGRLAWIFPVKDVIYGMVLHKDNLYFGSNDHHAYCLDPATGRLRWRFKTQNIVTYVIGAGDRAYFGSYDNQMYCVDAATGREVWRFPTNGFITYLAIHGNLLTFGSWDCHMYCVDAASGRLVWKFKTSLGTPSPIAPPETGMVKTAQLTLSPQEAKSTEDRYAPQSLQQAGSESVYTFRSEYTQKSQYAMKKR